MNPDRAIPPPTGPRFRPMGVDVYAPHSRFVHLVIHDTGHGIGFWREAIDSEISGCVIFNVGNVNRPGKDLSHGHGIYAQNDAGWKKLTGNLIASPFGFGIHAYPNPGAVVGFQIEGNTVVGAGAPSGSPLSAILIGPYGKFRADRIEILANHSYQPPLPLASPRPENASLCLGCLDPADSGSVTVRGNAFVGGPFGVGIRRWSKATFRENAIAASLAQVSAEGVPRAPRSDWDANRFVTARGVYGWQGKPLSFADWKAATGFDVGSVETGAPLDRVVVRPDTDERGRALVTVFNGSHLPVVNVALKGVLRKGDRYEIRNGADFLGAPVRRGVFDGKPIALPMEGLRVAKPVGAPAPKPTGPEFNVFVVRLREGKP